MKVTGSQRGSSYQGTRVLALSVSEIESPGVHMPVVWVQRNEGMFRHTGRHAHRSHDFRGTFKTSSEFLPHPPIHLFSVSPSRASLSQAETSKSSPQPHWFGLTSGCYGDLPQKMPIEREIKGQDHSLQGQERVPMGGMASQTLVTLPAPHLSEQCGHRHIQGRAPRITAGYSSD